MTKYINDIYNIKHDILNDIETQFISIGYRYFYFNMELQHPIHKEVSIIGLFLSKNKSINFTLSKYNSQPLEYIGSYLSVDDLNNILIELINHKKIL